MIEATRITHRYELHGKMVPKARPSASRQGDSVRMHMPASYRSCASSYRQQMRSQHRMDPIGKFRAIHLEVRTVVKRPKRRPEWVDPEVWRSGAAFSAPTAVGDVDNMAGTVMDAGNGVLWVDDCQVVTLSSSKLYASAEEPAGVVIVYVTEI